MNRRVLLLVLIIVIVAAAAVVVLMSGQNGTETPPPSTTEQADGGNGEQPEDTGPTETPFPTPDMTTVIIAVQDIQRGQEIPASALGLAPWPREALPFNAVDPNQFDIEDLAGSIARTDIVVEQPILLSYLAPSRAELAATGSDVATIIPEGKVGVTIPIDRLTSVAYGIQPGDRVDIAVALLFVNVDEEFQTRLPNELRLVGFQETQDESGTTRSLTIDATSVAGRFDSRNIPVGGGRTENWGVMEVPSEDTPRPRLTVQRTVLDAQVLWLGNFPPEGRIFDATPTPSKISVEIPAEGDGGVSTGDQSGTAPADTTTITVVERPTVVTVAVTAQEALVLTWLLEARVPMNFFLRSAADNSRVLTEAVTLDYIMQTYEIGVPPLRDYSIEPAIRSIRQLLTEDVVDIDQPEVSVSQGGNETPAEGGTGAEGGAAGGGQGGG